MNTIITVMILLFASIIGGNLGSMASIKRRWHQEEYYSKYIRPNIAKVCGFHTILIPPVLAYFLYPAIFRVDVRSGMQSMLVAGGIALFIATLFANVLGRMIYGQGEK